MKAKDLEVGMCVAIKDGYIKRAYVLEMGTRWVRDRGSWDEKYNRDSKSVAVAVAMRPFDRHPLNEQDFRPDVVNLNQIIDTWDNHIATEEAKRERTRLAIEKERKRKDEFRTRFDALGLGEYAQLDANGWVRIPLTDLERLLSKDEHQ